MVHPNKTIFRAGYVSIFGKPNVGKSTLLNQIVKIKLSITSPKPQTTRHRILGIHSAENSQILFLDTPGLIKPTYQLQKTMMTAVDAAVFDADIILYMIEAGEKLSQEDSDYLHRFIDTQKPVFLVLNKMDLVKKNRILPVMDHISKQFKVAEIVPLSAQKKEGLSDLVKEIVRYLPQSPPYYPVDMLTEHPERFIVSEIIREKIFYHFSDEIPYSTTVIIDEWSERKKRKDYIRAIIITEKESQKGILIGKEGSALKKIGAIARKEIEGWLGRPVYLEMWVKVKPKWRKNESAIREFGYGSQLPRK